MGRVADLVAAASAAHRGAQQASCSSSSSPSSRRSTAGAWPAISGLLFDVGVVGKVESHAQEPSSIQMPFCVGR
eukprot:3172881-Lingulodinium_polyedra.AAC.1